MGIVCDFLHIVKNKISTIISRPTANLEQLPQQWIDLIERKPFSVIKGRGGRLELTDEEILQIKLTLKKAKEETL